MLEWLYRGLSKGRVTTRYPRRPESAPAAFFGRVEPRDTTSADHTLAAVCPTGAIRVDEHHRLRLDRGRCILCGECTRADPERFEISHEYETAARARRSLVIGADDELTAAEPVAPPLLERAGMLRRSIHVRHIDCGSDGSEEWEIQALWNPYYDIQRLGFFLTNSPRHADILLVTGPVTAPMREPLQRTWKVMPEPKALLAVGTDACGGGLMAADAEATIDDRATAGGVDQVLAVDVYVPGSPPAPIAIMHGLLLAAGLVTPQETMA